MWDKKGLMRMSLYAKILPLYRHNKHTDTLYNNMGLHAQESHIQEFILQKYLQNKVKMNA